MKTEQTSSQQKVLYSKALSGSLPQSNAGTAPGGASLPSNMPGNSSTVSGNLYNHHKGQSGGHFSSGNGPRNMALNAGNMRGVSGKSGPSPNYLNRHNQPYQNSRMPSNSSSSPPLTSSGTVQPANNSVSTNGSTSASTASNASNNVSSISATGSSVLTNSVTNGNGNSTPDKSSTSDNASTSTISKTNLYIRGLTPNTTDKDLHSLCSPYGNIISTKAILDKETNKCRGYGFVDFEHPLSAENAVKSLISQGVQAQMAKCTDTNRNKNAMSKSSEHDPTNLYIANLPLNMTEADLETMLSMYGSVISTRILKDSNGTPRGVGFARMETKEKCDSIINLLNGKMLPGSKDTLLVKFADGGSKKKHYKNNDNRYRNDIDLQMGYDSTNLATNGVPTQLLPSPLGAASAYQRAFSATGSPYQNALQANPWLHQAPQYIMQPQMIPSNMDPNAALQYSPLMHQLTAQMSHLQMGGVSGAGYMPGTPHAYGAQAMYPQMLQSLPMSGEQQQEQINPSHSVSSGSASGEEQQQQQHSFQQMVYNQQK